MPSRVQAAPLRPAQPSNMALWGQFTYGRGAPRGLPGASGGGGCPIGRVPHQGATASPTAVGAIEYRLKQTAVGDASDRNACSPSQLAQRALVAAVSSAGPVQQAAQASIDNAACDGTSHFHPAALDSCLQLAAAAAISSALKVPAALACLLTPERLAAPQLAAASRQQGAATAADAPSLVDYWLMEPAGGFGVGIRSLELKPLSKLATAAAARTPAVGLPASTSATAEELLYEVSWPAAEPATLAAVASRVPVANTVRLLTHGGTETAAGAMAALQAAPLDSLGGAQLNTATALPAVVGAPSAAGGRAACLATNGGLPGLMRTLALEYQSQRFGSLDADKVAPAAADCPGTQLGFLPAGTAPSADAYGAAQRSGVHHLAALLPAKARSSITAFHLMPRPRGALSGLKPEPVATTIVAPGRVVMAVKAVGINFRSVEAWLQPFLLVPPPPPPPPPVPPHCSVCDLIGAVTD